MEELIRDIEGLYSYMELMDQDYWILVENEKDMFFWQKIFYDAVNTDSIYYDSISTFPYVNESSRGRGVLEKFLKQLNLTYNETEKKNMGLFIAWDSDYDILDSANQLDNIVINTYGYTIENTLFCTNRLTKIILEDTPLKINKYDDIKNELEEWFSDISSRLFEFLLINIAAEIMKRDGHDVPVVMGRTSDMYMNNGKTDLDDDIVALKVNEVKQEISQQYIDKANEKLSDCSKEMRLIISGHFLEKLVHRKLEQIVRRYKGQIKIELGDNKLSTKYSITVSELLKRSSEKCKERCIDRSTCPDFNYINNRIRNLCNSHGNC